MTQQENIPIYYRTSPQISTRLAEFRNGINVFCILVKSNFDTIDEDRALIPFFLAQWVKKETNKGGENPEAIFHIDLGDPNIGNLEKLLNRRFPQNVYFIYSFDTEKYPFPSYVDAKHIILFEEDWDVVYQNTRYEMA